MSSEPATVPAARRRGRPRSSATATAISRAATKLFAERGFSGTSVRDIASLAGSDPAVVIRSFGSKEKLFLEVVTLPPHFGNLVDGPLDGLGRDILRKLVEADDSTVRLYRTLLGAFDRPEVRRYLTESTSRNIVDPLAVRLTGRHSRMRAQLIAAQIGGLLMSICLSDEIARTVANPRALDHYARAIQTLVADAGQQSR